MARIMIVDDEPDVAATIKMGLEREGFIVDVFTEPQTALDHFKPDYYAMVITDLKMPGMNGFELYRELKKKDEKIKVVFMTAFDIFENEFHTVFKKTDVRCFFKKPVRISDLMTSVKEELSHEITSS